MEQEVTKMVLTAGAVLVGVLLVAVLVAASMRSSQISKKEEDTWYKNGR